MGTSNIEKKPTGYDRKQLRKAEDGKTVKKKDWTTWVIIGIIVAFIIIVACVFFVKKNNATGKTYVTIGDHELTQVEYNYYYYTIVNSYLSNYSDYLMFMGIDTSKPLDEQMCIYDSNLTWKDYFDQSAIPTIQAVKALVDEANANGFEYDPSADYEIYMSSVNYGIQSSGVSEDYYYENYYGKYASEKTLEPVVKEYLLYQAYYDKLLTDNAAAAEDVQAEYEANKNNYDVVDYYLYSIVADTEDDAADEEKAAALNDVEERANEFVDRFEAGEDWRELCYEYARESSKDSFDPENETDATQVTGSTITTISPNYSEWLYDDARTADDVMVYRDETNNACFIIRFSQKTAYDVEADSSDIAGTLANKKVTEHIESLLGNYQVADPGNNLPYLNKVSETTAETEAEPAGSEE